MSSAALLIWDCINARAHSHQLIVAEIALPEG